MRLPRWVLSYPDFRMDFDLLLQCWGLFFPPFLVTTPVHSAKGSMSYFLCWGGTHRFCKELTKKPGRGKCWAWAPDLVSFPPVCVASNVLFVLYRSWIIKHSGWSWTKTAGRRIYFLCRIDLLLFSENKWPTKTSAPSHSLCCAKAVSLLAI